MEQKKHSWRKTTGLAAALHGMQKAERLQTNDSGQEPKMADSSKWSHGNMERLGRGAAVMQEYSYIIRWWNKAQ